eukprot:47933_1
MDAEAISMTRQTVRFDVVSWNILCQSYIRIGRSFTYCEPQSLLDWSNRSKQVAQIILDLKADILCLQEVDHLKYYTGILCEAGYDFEFAQRTSGKVDGCLIAWKRGAFERVRGKSLVVEYNVLAMEASSKTLASKLRTDSVGLIIALKPKHCPFPILVGNTHLYWNPRCPDVKLAQITYFIREISKMRESLQKILKRDIPVIIGGDLNSMPPSEVYKFMTEGSCDYAAPFEMDNWHDGKAKLLMDQELFRVGRWLNGIGVDVTFLPRTNEKRSRIREAMSSAESENRVLVTSCKKFSRQKYHPPLLMVGCRVSKLRAFKEIVRTMGYQINLETPRKFDEIIHPNDSILCSSCNSTIQQVDLASLDASILPKSTSTGFNEKGLPLDFFKCSGCSVVFWHIRGWMNRKEERRLLKLKELFNEKECASEGPTTPNDVVFVPSVTNETVLISRDSLRHNIKLASAYAECGSERKESEYTNITEKFQGCLDYIFFSRDTILCTDVEPLRQDGSLLPDESWPSDHLALKSSFQLLNQKK